MKCDPDKIRKAAVLVSSLDDNTADALLDQLPVETADLVRRACAALDSIDTSEQEAVIGEIFGHGPDLAPGPAEAAAREDEGVELSDKLAREFGLSQHGPVDVSPAADPAPGAHSPFGFLQQATSARIAPLLCGESPQAIALVASHLSPRQSLELLSALPADVQADVVRRMALLGDTDQEIVREVERGLQAQMAQRSEQEQRQSDSMARLKQIVQYAPDDARQMLLDNLALHEPGLAEQLGHSWPAEDLSITSSATDTAPALPRYRSLDELSDAELSATLQAADPELTTLALAGASPTLIDRVVRRFAPAAGRRFRHALNRLGPTRLRDIEQAQQELLALAEKLAAEAGESQHAAPHAAILAPAA